MKNLFFLFLFTICSNAHGQELLITPDRDVKSHYTENDLAALAWEIENISKKNVEFFISDDFIIVNKQNGVRSYLHGTHGQYDLDKGAKYLNLKSGEKVYVFQTIGKTRKYFSIIWGAEYSIVATAVTKKDRYSSAEHIFKIDKEKSDEVTAFRLQETLLKDKVDELMNLYASGLSGTSAKIRNYILTKIVEFAPPYFSTGLHYDKEVSLLIDAWKMAGDNLSKKYIAYHFYFIYKRDYLRNTEIINTLKTYPEAYEIYKSNLKVFKGIEIE